MSQTNEWGESVVPCCLCGKPTSMTGTKLCDRCWELKMRIKADPALAHRILMELETLTDAHITP